MRAALSGILMAFLLAGCEGLPRFGGLPRFVGLPRLLAPTQPTVVLSATPSATPSPAPSATATATPTPIIPSRMGTPLPAQLQTISTQNIGQLALLAQWGNGIPHQAGWSADGSLLAVASTSGIQLYSGENFISQGTLTDNRSLRSLAFSPDGRILAAGSEEGDVTLWELEGRRLERTLRGQQGVVLSLAFSPDGKLLASGSWDRTIQVWDSGSWELLARLTGHRSGVQNVSFSPDSQRVFSWGRRDPLREWNISKARQTREFYLGSAGKGQTGSAGTFSTSGAVFAVSQGQRVRIHRTDNGSTLAQLTRFKFEVELAAVSPDGELAATVDGGSLRLWQIKNSSQLWEIQISPVFGGVRLLAFAPDGRKLLAVGERLQVWELADPPGALQHPLPAGYASAYRMAVIFAPDGSSTTAAFMNGMLQSYRIANGESLPAPWLGGGMLNALTTSPDQTLAASVAADRTIQIWRLDNGSLIQSLRGHELMADCLAFSPDGRLLASGAADKTVRLWEVESGKLIQTLRTPAGVARLAFSPTGGALAAGAGETILLWRSSDWSQMQTLKGRNPLFSADGSLLARVMAEGGKQIVVLQGVGEDHPRLRIPTEGSSLAFSPAGDLLAVSGMDITLWEVQSGRLLQKVENPSRHGKVIFSPDGKLLLLSAGDGRFYGWGVP